MPATREEAVTIFKRWINQRAGLDPANYGCHLEQAKYSSRQQQIDALQSMRQEARSIQNDGKRARLALAEFASLPYDAEVLRVAMRGSFSGRLQFNERGELDYCTGQYFPTEYRKAAAAVLVEYVCAMRQRGIGIPESALIQHGETITVSELKAIAKGHGSHFFDAGTMRFFNSKVHDPVYTGADGWYFVTSEQDTGIGKGGTPFPRKYTVRRMDKDAEIDEPEPGGHDNFQKYSTAAQAQRVARQLAEQSRG